MERGLREGSMVPSWYHGGTMVPPWCVQESARGRQVRAVASVIPNAYVSPVGVREGERPREPRNPRTKEERKMQNGWAKPLEATPKPHQCDIKATSMRVASQAVATPKP